MQEIGKYFFLLIGGPETLQQEELRQEFSRAQQFTNSQKSRHPGNFGRMGGLMADLADPDGSDDMEEGQGTDGFQLWRLLPHLQGLPEDMLYKLPLSAMFQLNTALGKEQKNTDKMGVNTRLAMNVQKIARKPIQVKEGLDNRKSMLHPARFIGGACCSATELWLEAKGVLGERGTTPLGSYDLDSLGCGGSVTPKGWQELHNPASQELKLKLFHLPNVANSGMQARKVNLDGGDEGLSIGESMREIVDLDSYKMALNTLREAMASALPWNRSIGAIIGLMMNTNFMQEDLGGNVRRAAVLTEFTDYVLGRNALNWENDQAFLTADELSHVWTNWKGKRGGYFTAKMGGEKPKRNTSDKRVLSEICRKFNTGDCPSQSQKECKTPWGKTLKHICNKYLPGGKVCTKDHARKDH